MEEQQKEETMLFTWKSDGHGKTLQWLKKLKTNLSLILFCCCFFNFKLFLAQSNCFTYSTNQSYLNFTLVVCKEVSPLQLEKVKMLVQADKN